MPPDPDVRAMRDYLRLSLGAVGIPGADIRWEGSYFTVAGTGVEVASERTREGRVWRVRNVYDLPDLKDGGYLPVEETLSVHRAGLELGIAKAVAMKVVELRIDKALDDGA